MGLDYFQDGFKNCVLENRVWWHIHFYEKTYSFIVLVRSELLARSCLNPID